jgi:hypothetical protein
MHTHMRCILGCVINARQPSALFELLQQVVSGGAPIADVVMVPKQCHSHSGKLHRQLHSKVLQSLWWAEENPINR